MLKNWNTTFCNLSIKSCLFFKLLKIKYKLYSFGQVLCRVLYFSTNYCSSRNEWFPIILIIIILSFGAGLVINLILILIRSIKWKWLGVFIILWLSFSLLLPSFWNSSPKWKHLFLFSYLSQTLLLIRHNMEMTVLPRCYHFMRLKYIMKMIYLIIN